MPQFTYREIIKKLRKKGFFLAKQAAGSHEIWCKQDSEVRIIIANHPGGVPTGTVLKIIKKAGFKGFADFQNFKS